MKTFKKVLIILAIVVLAGFAGFKILGSRVVADAQKLPLVKLDLTQIADGDYTGSYKIFPVNVSLKVSVKDGAIARIELLEHFNGKGAAAEKITEDIIEKQSLQVDCITSATVSSKAILKAVEDALIGK